MANVVADALSRTAQDSMNNVVSTWLSLLKELENLGVQLVMDKQVCNC